MTGDLDDDAPAEVARRLARYALTSDPAALWPGLIERARVAAAREIERVTRARVRGDIDIELDPVGEHEPYALRIAGFTSGMGPLLGRWIETGLVRGRPAVAEPFVDALSHGRRRAARIEREMLPALDALLAHGVAPVALKGFHTSRVYFEEPGVRRMADVDLLVSAGRLPDAEQALRTAGFRPRGDDAAARDKRDWIGPGVDDREFSLECAHERSRWTLELHTSLDRVFHPGAVARLDGEARPDPLDIAGRRIAGLDPSVLVLSLACHCSQELDSSRLLRLVELVRVIRAERSSGRLDWDGLLAMMSRTGTSRYAYPALALAEVLAPGTVDSRVLRAGRRDSTWAARHTVDRLVPAGGSLDERGVIRQLMWTRGTLAVAQRALRVLWPASFTRPRDVLPGWKTRLRRWRSGGLRLRAPDERA